MKFQQLLAVDGEALAKELENADVRLLGSIELTPEQSNEVYETTGIRLKNLNIASQSVGDLSVVSLPVVTSW